MAIPVILQAGPEEATCTERTGATLSSGTERAIVEKPVKPQDVHDTDATNATRAVTRAEQEIQKGKEQQTASALTVAQLYEQFRRPIHSYVYRLLGNQEDADDVTQEVFVRAYTSWHGLYERERLSPWLYRIATNLCVDILRRRKRISWWSLSNRTRHNEYGEEEVSEDTLAFLADNGGIPEVAEREQIRAALSAMPPEYATALVLSVAQGIPYQEVAAIAGISPNAAATRISRAKRMFIEQYQRLGKEIQEKPQ
jgi:RNA polymerase sigma-70 factor (ECF subfamily)